jgi:two-component sensor histidine kinase
VASSGLFGLAVTGAALFVIFRGLQERREIQENLRLSLAEKEILLKEVHHRVKNNLQVISGLLSLESEKLKDPAAVSVFNECRDRIHSMARLHQQLYARGRFAHVEFGAHLEETAAMLVRAHMPPGCVVEFRAEVAPLDVDLDLAVNLGLIANELILNSLKHAFAGRSSGTLTVGLHAGDPGELIVRDDGRGYPPDFDPKAGAGLGLELVIGLTGQIRGEAVLRNDAAGGASAVIRFPISHPEKTDRS